MVLLFSFLFLVVFEVTNAWNNNAALTPPMGWANWNAFACNYTESTIKQQSRALVNLGLRDVGFNLMIVQECIGINRTANGTMIVDPSRFPSGMQPLTDFIHSLDLKAGIYTDAGPLTCAKYVGSAGYEYIDAYTFIKEWGFDFIEDDNCYHEETGKSMKQLYTIMHDAIEATDSSTIFYATCQGQDNVELWGFPIAHVQRTTTDIAVPPNFENVVAHFHRNTEFANGNGPGHWMGADMMVIGLNGLSEIECKSHFSMWCIMAAPLWISTDLTVIEEPILDILKNEEVIAVNQDELGYGCVQLDGLHSTNNDTEVWWKVLKPKENETNAAAVMLFNTVSDKVQEIGFEFWEIGFNGNATVRDLWLHKDVGVLNQYKNNVDPHGVVLLRISQ